MCRITISRFDRDHDVFEALANELPARDGRVWSAGCASGEEPYTLAILFPNLREIVATDVDAQLIERAHRGCYPSGCLRELPEHLREQAFVREGELFCVRPEHRRAIEFRCEDLRETMPDGPFDAILCRNLAFTYFDEPVQREVATAMLARLRPDGVLVIGARERLPTGLELQESSRGCYRRVR
jgi:chemotaxis protein methyltransferase CheR